MICQFWANESGNSQITLRNLPYTSFQGKMCDMVYSNQGCFVNSGLKLVLDDSRTCIF